MSRIKLLLIDIFLILVAVTAALYFVYQNDDLPFVIGEKNAKKLGIRSEKIIAPRTRKATYLTIQEGADVAVGAANEAVKAAYPVQTEEGRTRGLAVLMYHNVYDPMDPPYPIDDNYISTEVLREELQYLKDQGYSFPSWERVRKYVDGEIDLPEKSVVLTFDDGTKGFRENGIPLLEEFDIPATAFIIASKNGADWAEFAKKHPLITLESHSYDMHRAGGYIGHNGIMTALTEEQIIEDLTKSAEVLGNGRVFAYPYGDFDPEGKCRGAVERVGYLLGFTTVYGKVYPGADPMLLPRVRINGSTPIASFIDMI